MTPEKGVGVCERYIFIVSARVCACVLLVILVIYSWLATYSDIKVNLTKKCSIPLNIIQNGISNAI